MFRNTYIIVICAFLSAQLEAQCYPDRHTTNLMDGWLSCQESQNPHGLFGESHWIRYDFGQSRTLHDVQLWNITHPDYIKSGIKTAVFSRSNNGVNWTVVDTFTIPRGYYSGFYEGSRSVDLGGVNARYLLITSLESYGDLCVGFGEIKIYTSPQEQSELTLDYYPCENSGIHKRLSGGMGRGGTYSGPGVTDNGDDSFDFDPDDLGPGSYTITYDYQDGGPQSRSAQITVLPCGHEYCTDCDDCDSFDQADLDSPDIPTGKYHGDLVSSTGQVTPTRDVDLRGRQEVTLGPGFGVESSSIFTAQIRECFTDMVTNGGFEDNYDNWSVWDTPDSTTVTHQIITDDIFEGQQAMQVMVIDDHWQNWRVQLNNYDHEIVGNQKYRISVTHRSPDAEGFVLVMELQGDPWTNHYSVFVPHTDLWETSSFTFELPEDPAFELRISLQMANYAGEHNFDRVRLVELSD